MLTDSKVRGVKPLRAPRKLFDGRGLYLLVTPKGGRYWRYNYRFDGKHKTLALGIYPSPSPRPECAIRKQGASWPMASIHRLTGEYCERDSRLGRPRERIAMAEPLGSARCHRDLPMNYFG
jgi:hypothetical protein